jgi:hypothetical protein
MQPSAAGLSRRKIGVLSFCYFQRSGVHKTGPRNLCSKIRLGEVRLGASKALSARASDTKCVMGQKIGSSTSVKKNIVLWMSVSLVVEAARVAL